MDKNVMTLDEAAEFLRTPKSTLYKMLVANKIPAKKVGRQWRFNRGDLDHWLSQESKDTSKPVASVSSNSRVTPRETAVAPRSSGGEISDLTKEDRPFRPSAGIIAQANVKDSTIYDWAREEGPKFWESYAGELHWVIKWNKPREW